MGMPAVVNRRLLLLLGQLYQLQGKPWRMITISSTAGCTVKEKHASPEIIKAYRHPLHIAKSKISDCMQCNVIKGK
jgi:hydrogenase maturation factor